MGSVPPPAPAAPSPGFLRVFQREADAAGRLSFAAFMRLALYDPEVGYYRQSRPRVGRGEGTDFYTASSTGSLFGELVAAAARDLLTQRGVDARDFTFVEIGAESAAGILDGVDHGFAALQVRRLGESLALNGPCVVFSNELFDAQPCERWVRTETGWAEVMVELRGSELRELLQPPTEPPTDLPAEVPPGYRLDAPRAAAALAGELAQQPWRGLFLAFDYGKSWPELATETPAGTVRAYYRHTQSNDLLARPGAQDLTCHVCWDWLAAALHDQGFAVDPVVAQETFFVIRTAAALEQVMTREAGQLTRRKLALLQLLHPAHLGRKFQVLTGWRERDGMRSD